MPSRQIWIKPSASEGLENKTKLDDDTVTHLFLYLIFNLKGHLEVTICTVCRII